MGVIPHPWWCSEECCDRKEPCSQETSHILQDLKHFFVCAETSYMEMGRKNRSQMIWKWAPLGNKPLVQLKPCCSLSVVVVATLFAAVSGTGSRAELDGGSLCPRSSCWFHFASCLIFLLLVLALAEWASSPGTAVGTQLSLEWEPTWEPLRKQQLLQEPLRATAHIALQQCLLNGELCSKLTSQGWKKSFWCTSLQEDSTKQLQSNSSKYYLTSYYRAYSFMHHMQHCSVPVLFMWIAELGKGSSGQKITGCDVCAGTPYSKLLLVNKWDFSFLCIKYTEARKCHYSAMSTCRWLF